MKITGIDARQYRIPLPVMLSDSTHGEISHFALVTARVRADDGSEGLGYSYTVGDVGGAALHSLVARDLAPPLAGEDPRRVA